MRPIKFRAWDSKRERMLGWDIVESFSLGAISRDSKNGAAVFMMQFTGLCDKNRKEIWEGDIIQKESRFCTPKMLKGVVEFDAAEFRGFPRRKVEVVGKGKRWVTIALIPDDGTQVEVIGNVYQNPELLDEKSKPASKGLLSSPDSIGGASFLGSFTHRS